MPDLLLQGSLSYRTRHLTEPDDRGSINTEEWKRSISLRMACVSMIGLPRDQQGVFGGGQHLSSELALCGRPMLVSRAAPMVETISAVVELHEWRRCPTGGPPQALLAVCWSSKE
jgi:hypothetical protein